MRMACTERIWVGISDPSERVVPCGAATHCADMGGINGSELLLNCIEKPMGITISRGSGRSDTVCGPGYEKSLTNLTGSAEMNPTHWTKSILSQVCCRAVSIPESETGYRL